MYVAFLPYMKDKRIRVKGVLLDLRRHVHARLSVV